MNTSLHLKPRAFPLLALLLVAMLVAAVLPSGRSGNDDSRQEFAAQDSSSARVPATSPAPVTTRAGDSGNFPGWGASHFPHEYHVDDLAIACVDCHHETNATRLVMPHEDYFRDFWIDCTICHRTEHDAALEPQYCGDCHHASPRGTADETLSAKVVIHQLCWDCHDRGTGAEAAANCGYCHDRLTEDH